MHLLVNTVQFLILSGIKHGVLFHYAVIIRLRKCQLLGRYLSGLMSFITVNLFFFFFMFVS